MTGPGHCLLSRAQCMPHLVHRPCRCHCLHDVFPPAVGTHWEAPANDLAHGGQVGGDAKVCLGAALGYPKAGHDLVEAEQGALLCGDVAQTLQQSRCGFTELACICKQSFGGGR